MNIQFIQPIEKRQLPPMNLYDFYIPTERIWNSFSESPQDEKDDELMSHIEDNDN